MERHNMQMPLIFNMWNNNAQGNNNFRNYCPLTSAIRELSTKPEVDDFHQLRKIVQTASPRALGELLRSACRKGILRDVELMLPIAIANGLTVDINESLCLACQNNHIAVMKLLLHNGAEVNYNNNLPLRRAVSGGHVEAAEYLLNNGADVHSDDDKLLMVCCQSGDYVDVLKLLISRDIDVLKNYHAAYNCCLHFGRNECGSELVRYSNTKPSNKSSSPAKECNDEIEKLLEKEEYNELNEESCDSDEYCSNDTSIHTDESCTDTEDEHTDTNNQSDDNVSPPSNDNTTNPRNDCEPQSDCQSQTTDTSNPRNDCEPQSDCQSQTTETNNTNEPQSSD
ncbi:ankyrin repeat protein [Tupanvirus soda lake]|uniref:Ankyrin repeat protein n=2 Tax=Tupanvirus TaxID=2094720 RepID=A0A6N1NUB3_9VIRU|nr:ankyrin repeat protein [Tupanvirus soda lake]QKU35917.1 ankyrin repeat protein [Tupanvirus soda lake]